MLEGVSQGNALPFAMQLVLQQSLVEPALWHILPFSPIS